MRHVVLPRGFSLLETLVAAAILALATLVAAPSVAELMGQMTIRSASQTVSTMLLAARTRALYHHCEVGVRMTATPDGDLVFATYQDGNHNGVLSADIRSGVDTLVGQPVSMKARFGKVRFSFLPGFAALDPSGAPIGDLADPIRFGRSDICSFSPEGTASPGSIYLSDRRGRQEVVRIHPVMSRIQVLEYRPGTKKWQRLF